MHRFYGAVSDRTMRPEVTFADLRAATGNTGNVEENKSLYWNPVIYKVEDNSPNFMCKFFSVKGRFQQGGGPSRGLLQNWQSFVDSSSAQVLNPAGTPTFQLVPVWFASAYYIWQTGVAKAFPAGLKMRASDARLSRATAVCAGQSACERGDAGGCAAHTSGQTSGILPVSACRGRQRTRGT